jgi:N-acetylglutamate synthase/N-acetylornithine aminotransferase
MPYSVWRIRGLAKQNGEISPNFATQNSVWRIRGLAKENGEISPNFA